MCAAFLTRLRKRVFGHALGLAGLPTLRPIGPVRSYLCYDPLSRRGSPTPQKSV